MLPRAEYEDCLAEHRAEREANVRYVKDFELLVCVNGVFLEDNLRVSFNPENLKQRRAVITACLPAFLVRNGFEIVGDIATWKMEPSVKLQTSYIDIPYGVCKRKR